MDKHILTIEDVRRLLKGEALFLRDGINVDAMSDQDLLNSDLRYGLRLDSLDIVDMVLTLERDHNLVISEATVVENIKKGGTVGNFIEAVNKHSLSAKK